MRGLSTGNRREAGLVGAFMARPELLILDEPANGLDPLMQQVFPATVEEARDHGQSVLLSSHILSEAERVADLAAVLQGGKLAASGPTRELRRQAAQRFHITFAEGQDVPLDALAAPDGASGGERRRPEGQEVSHHDPRARPGQDRTQRGRPPAGGLDPGAALHQARQQADRSRGGGRPSVPAAGDNAHMRKFTGTLSLGIPVAHGEAGDRLASLADLFSGLVEQTEALVADGEARRTTS
ncbi:hypothetical protein [Streptomyces cyaneofuscatus]|uniref:hypothetical protein n=1 Tax=Streptomyces cyaneofuscatus TaxID=66883 RepID=UPI0037991642